MSITISKLLEFHLFPKLPHELRLEIWRFALPPPRVVELRPTGRAGKRRFWITDTSPPVLLRVCHEAREVALGSYSPVSAWNQTRPVLTRAYIAYSKDIVYLSDSWCKRLWENIIYSKIGDIPVALDKVQYFAVDCDRRVAGYSPWSRILTTGAEGPAFLQNDMSRQNAVRFVVSFLTYFQNLKHFLLVADKRRTLQEGMDELLEPTDAYETCCEKSLREIRAENFPALLEEVQARNPNLNIPSIQFKILIKSGQISVLGHRFACYRYCTARRNVMNLESDSDD